MAMRTGWVLLVGLGLGSAAMAEIRVFETPDGKTVEAEIVDYNPTLGQVTLKRLDGRRIPVKADVFVEADQLYIKEWNAAKAFTSENLLRISCAEEILKDWKDEVYKDLRDTEGNVETHLMKEIKYEDIAYTLDLRNSNKTSLDKIRMEYRIYYEQSRESRDKPEAGQYVLAGEMNLPTLPGGKSTRITTDAVTIYDDDINSIDWSDGSARVGGKGEVAGIRAKLYLKTASGTEMMREMSHPKNLSNEAFPWKRGTRKPPAPLDAPRKK